LGAFVAGVEVGVGVGVVVVEPGVVAALGPAAPPVLAPAPAASAPAQESAASRASRVVVNRIRIVLVDAYGVS
jgi:hypothetical protein